MIADFDEETLRAIEAAMHDAKFIGPGVVDYMQIDQDKLDKLKEIAMDAKQIKSIVFTAADGIAYIYPVTAPFVAVIEKVINLLDESGAFPQVLHPEAQAALIAGMAAAHASGATTGIEAYKRAHQAQQAQPNTQVAVDVFAGLKKE